MRLIVDIYKDYLAYSENYNSKLKPFININFYTNINYRLSRFFREIYLIPIAKLFWLINRVVFSVDLSPSSDLAGGLVIIHGLGLVVGGKVKSEGKLHLYQGVTLGGNGNKKSTYNEEIITQPIIKDNVSIFAGAVVFGPIIIEGSVQIGVNSVISKSIPFNHIAFGYNQIKKRN